MEFATDLMTSLRERLGTGVHSTASAGLEWPGLHARLAAAHAARQALGAGEKRKSVVFGGFSNWQADFGLPQENPSRAVNRTDSTNSKTPAGIEGAVATEPFAGGRGQ